ncbi:hypothetical protein L227DRAFT_296254 [Lentinus tigrinus ALCF2SS1-6]|uniref:Uncharacterized protein n=1 Tax=Lentinus tigrinus ALCF2SS1-6 TaxID=1328759 RepID=A0A5C2RXT7_9APHY|nr:hypothetical protein L227DRAFT_296254 [Lentinus tigrinus ALCF2SS1-6]
MATVPPASRGMAVAEPCKGSSAHYVVRDGVCIFLLFTCLLRIALRMVNVQQPASWQRFDSIGDWELSTAGGRVVLTGKAEVPAIVSKDGLERLQAVLVPRRTPSRPRTRLRVGRNRTNCRFLQSSVNGGLPASRLVPGPEKFCVWKIGA